MEFLAAMSAANGQDFDQKFANILRLAHGQVFSVIAQVRATTRNSLVRELADQANATVLDHITVLEKTGLVDFDRIAADTTASPTDPAAAVPVSPAPGEPTFIVTPSPTYSLPRRLLPPAAAAEMSDPMPTRQRMTHRRRLTTRQLVLIAVLALLGSGGTFALVTGSASAQLRSDSGHAGGWQRPNPGNGTKAGGGPGDGGQSGSAAPPSPVPASASSTGGGAQTNGPSPEDFTDIRSVRPNVQRAANRRGASRGTFTARCGRNENKHHNPDNFIVAPGVANGAHHVHDYVGNLEHRRLLDQRVTGRGRHDLRPRGQVDVLLAGAAHPLRQRRAGRRRQHRRHPAGDLRATALRRQPGDQGGGDAVHAADHHG